MQKRKLYSLHCINLQTLMDAMASIALQRMLATFIYLAINPKWPAELTQRGRLRKWQGRMSEVVPPSTAWYQDLEETIRVGDELGYTTYPLHALVLASLGVHTEKLPPWAQGILILVAPRDRLRFIEALYSRVAIPRVHVGEILAAIKRYAARENLASSQCEAALEAVEMATRDISPRILEGVPKMGGGSSEKAGSSTVFA